MRLVIRELAQGFRPGLTQTRLFSHRKLLTGLEMYLRVVLYCIYRENNGADQILDYCSPLFLHIGSRSDSNY